MRAVGGKGVDMGHGRFLKVVKWEKETSILRNGIICMRITKAQKPNE